MILQKTDAQQRHAITVLSNGRAVYAYLTHSPVAAALSRQPHLASLMREALVGLDFSGAAIDVEQDIGHAIGYCELVATSDEDVVFYAQEPRSQTYTRFVKNRKAEPTSFLAITLQQDSAGDYEVTNVGLGKACPPVPGDAGATAVSMSYWAEHAVIFNGQPLLSQSIVKDCPY